MVSYGIMDAILKKGYQIPDDFSVCGFDNDFASSLLPISLTTVEHYMEDKGKKAFDMIYEKIQEKEDLEAFPALGHRITCVTQIKTYFS